MGFLFIRLCRGRSAADGVAFILPDLSAFRRLALAPSLCGSSVLRFCLRHFPRTPVLRLFAICSGWAFAGGLWFSGRQVGLFVCLPARIAPLGLCDGCCWSCRRVRFCLRARWLCVSLRAPQALGLCFGVYPSFTSLRPLPSLFAFSFFFFFFSLFRSALVFRSYPAGLLLPCRRHGPFLPAVAPWALLPSLLARLSRLGAPAPRRQFLCLCANPSPSFRFLPGSSFFAFALRPLCFAPLLRCLSYALFVLPSSLPPSLLGLFLLHSRLPSPCSVRSCSWPSCALPFVHCRFGCPCLSVSLPSGVVSPFARLFDCFCFCRPACTFCPSASLGAF